MNGKSTFKLAFVTAFVAAFAAALVTSKSGSTSAANTHEKLFPALLDSINEVSSLTLENAEGKVTLERTGEIWGLTSKNNYPVNMELVSECLRGLALMETVEKKTSKPEFYSKLGVAGVGEGSISTQITLGAGDKIVADLIVGEKRAGRTSGDEYYVRLNDDEQTWLVSAPLKTKTDSTVWIDKQIAKIERARVQAVRVEHASGEILQISKPNSEALVFDVQGIPQDRELSYAAVADGMATTLEWLNLEDVIPSGELELNEEWATKTTFWTFEGLQLEVTVTPKDDEHWAKFAVDFDGDGAPFGEPVTIEASEATTAEIATLNERFSRWTYKLPVHSITALGKRMSQLLKPLPVEPDEAAPTDNTRIEDLLSPEQLEQLKLGRDE